MSHTWRSRDEVFHGSKWGYVVVALVILIVLSLLGAIFYLTGQGLKNLGLEQIDIEYAFAYGAAAVLILLGIIFLVFLMAKAGFIAIATVSGAMSYIYGFFAYIWNIIWTLFSNIYILLLAVILVIALLSALFVAASVDLQVNLSNPLVIGALIVLLIVFFPFAIFIIDLFSLEHE